VEATAQQELNFLLLFKDSTGTGMVLGFQCAYLLCKALGEGAVQDVGLSTLRVPAVE